MKFKQSVSDFLKSKTNILGLTSIVSGAVGYYTKALSPIESVQSIGAGLGLIFVKDAITGASKNAS